MTPMHMRYPQEVNDDHEITDLARRITFGGKARCPKHTDVYDLTEFTLEQRRIVMESFLLSY